MSVDRRGLLRALVATGGLGLAGCTGSNDGERRTTAPPNESQPTESDGTPEQTGTAPPSTGTASPRSSWTPGPTPTQPGESFESPFRFDVEVVNSQPTASDPPTVRVSVTNEDDTTHSLDTPGYQFPFTGAMDTTDRGSISLLTPLNDWEDRDGECWAGTPKAQPSHNGESFEPGQSISARRAIMNSDKCDGQSQVDWPRDTFLFTESYALDSSEPEAYDGEKFFWGFWLRVTDTPSIQVGKIQPFKN